MCRRLAGVSSHHDGCSCRAGAMQEGREAPGGVPAAVSQAPSPSSSCEPLSSHRCDESCLSCEGSSRKCSRCKVGFTLLGNTCITNHTCSNGEHRGGGRVGQGMHLG